MLSIQPRVMIAACALLIPFAVACEPAADEPDVDPIPAEEVTPAVEAAPAELDARGESYIDAWNGDDPGAAAEYFTEDATATIGDDTYQGRAEIEAHWLQMVPNTSNLETTETSRQQVGDDWLVEGTYSVTISPPDADPVEQEGHYTATWTHDADGEWRISATEVQADEEPEEY